MKKTIDYYMSLPYRLENIFDTEEDGYGVCYLELARCIICSDTIEDIIANAKDSKKAWIEAALEEGIDIAEPQQDTDLSEFSGQVNHPLSKANGLPASSTS